MDKKKRTGFISLIVCLAVSVALAIGFEVMYSMTRYLPLCLFAILCLMPTVTYAPILLFRFRIPVEDVPTAPEAHEDPGGEDKDDDNKKSKKKKRRNASISGKLRRVLNALARFYNRHRSRAAVIVAIGANIALHVRFFIMLRRMTSLYTLNYVFLVAMLMIFIVLISIEKWCAHTADDESDEFLRAMNRNVRSSLILIRTALILVAVAIALKLVGIYDAQSILRIVLAVIWYYASVFTLISLAVAVIKKNVLTAPALHVPTPFSIGSRGFGLISYLEENTGITMRSLWSIHMVRKLIPYTLAAIAIVLWLSTGIVQVESYERAVVYRFGHLSENTLDAGIHLTLPWPLDKVVKHNTETVKKMVIGYKSVEDGDNTWSGEHGTSEYRLLLGSIDELVSINLRIEYKISDVYKYVKSSAAPDKILEAETYHLVTDETIHTDLDTLLSIDRSAFASSFRTELSERIAEYDTGIEIVSVVLESIHPPIDVADVYHGIVSAEIQAEKLILDAEAYAAKTVTNAEAQSYRDVSAANAENHSKIAAAQSAVAEFMAGVEADKAHPDSYRYYKYMSAITKAYGSARLVIVGDGIDSSNIYFGSLDKLGTNQ